ncbi:MAG: D-glucuronyl C5-epimerase family protein [Actinomycetota bacterium]|nr:D-glucuronyl C5-epimerase family protein [Actinomycetota bacterium]
MIHNYKPQLHQRATIKKARLTAYKNIIFLLILLLSIPQSLVLANQPIAGSENKSKPYLSEYLRASLEGTSQASSSSTILAASEDTSQAKSQANLGNSTPTTSGYTSQENTLSASSNSSNDQNVNKLLTPFPLVCAIIPKPADSPTDKNGIIMVKYGNKLEYNPGTIAAYATIYYANYYTTGSSSSLTNFLKYVGWLKNNFRVKSGYGIWEYKFDYSPYNQTAPWPSAISQGIGISAMLEAWKLTGDSAYFNIASLALQGFKVPCSQGGVKSSYTDGLVCYEAYPGLPSSHVLNGFMFALAGIYDYYRLTNDQNAKELFNNGVFSLRRHLADYDIGFTSIYDQYYKYKAVARDYHTMHIKQLLWLYHATKDQFFYVYAKKWLNYDTGFIKSATASSSIDSRCCGPQKLYDGNKYYNYWSSNKFPVSVQLDMGEEVAKISAIVLYGTLANQLPKRFLVSVSNDRKRWVSILSINGNKPQLTNYNKTGTYETFIWGYKIPNPAYARFIKITAYSTYGSKILGLREIDIHFDQTKNVNNMYNALLANFEPRPFAQ